MQLPEMLLLSASERRLVAATVPDVATLPRIAVTLLGDFAVSVNGAAIDATRWKFKHPRLLLQMLCLAPGHRVSRDEATEALWPQANTQAACNRLHHALHTLRAILRGAGLSDARLLVQLQAGTLLLDSSVVLDLDVTRFVQAVAAARACDGAAAGLAHLENARAEHRGAFAVPAAVDDWFAPHRKAVLRDQVWVLEQLALRHRAAGHVDQALQTYKELVQAEPSNELAHRSLIELHAAQQRPDLVARQYAACRRYLRRDLGVEPSPMTRQLMQSVADKARDSPGPATDVVARQRVRFVAPLHASPLLGREADLAELQRWLLDEGARLITIAAAGGVGKTRLAAALAEQVQEHFSDGVHFVALGALNQPSRLAERVCHALGITTAEQPAERLLPAALATRHLLLVLDCFEHLVDAAPQLCDWLKAAPRLHIVVTSQCAMKSRAERVYELPTLLVRDPRAAIDLFSLTARGVGAALCLPDGEPVIRRICERVGGNTLAIELAAAQLARVKLADVLAELTRAPLVFLAGTAPDGERRHTSLEATIGWSCSLLAPAEAALLTLASVFAGDFNAEDAQAVLGELLGAGTVPALLGALVRRHLLVVRVDAAQHASKRFAMLDAVQAFARRAALSDQRCARVQLLHANHFSNIVKQAREWRIKGQNAEAGSIFRASTADFEQALRWMREHASTQDYLRTCSQNGLLQLSYGFLREAEESLRAATRVHAHSQGEKDESAQCHRQLSIALRTVGDLRGATQMAQAARGLAKDSTDEVLRERIDYQLSLLSLSQLRIDAALKSVAGSISLLLRHGREDLLTSELLQARACVAICGDYARSRALVELVIDRAHQAQRPMDLMCALAHLSEVETLIGRLDLAQESLRECAALVGAAYEANAQAAVLTNLSTLAFERCYFVEAVEHADRALIHLRSARPTHAVVARLCHEHVLMETGREADTKVLPTLSEREFPFDPDWAPEYVRSRVYRLRLLAERGEWPEARKTLALLRQLVQRTGNPLWASWVAEAAAVAGRALGCNELAQAFLTLSRQLQSAHGMLSTPRQVASWSRHEARLREAGPVCAAAGAAGSVAAMLEQLLPTLRPLLRPLPPQPLVDRLLSELQPTARRAA
jgi:DNA-binding SARP family transcriptional activator/predicted ATPase